MKKPIAVVYFIVLVIFCFSGCGIAAPATSGVTVSAAEPPAVSVSPASSAQVSPPAGSAPASASLSPSETQSEEPAATASPAPGVSQANIAAIAKQTISYENEYIKADAEYPVISGLSDSTRQKDINDEIYNAIKSEVDQAEADSKDQEEAQQYYYEAGFSVCRNDGKILSIRVDTDEWTGGADEAVSSEFYNYLSADLGSQLKLGDLFTPGADYLSSINNAINADIAADPSSAGDYSFTGVSEDAGFCITDTDLVIVFGEGAIAPQAEGEPEFKIPLKDLSGILIQELR